MQRATCRGCGARIHWIKTLSGKAMLVDPGRKTVVTEDGRTIQGYTPWATCPKAADFKQ